VIAAQRRFAGHSPLLITRYDQITNEVVAPSPTATL
ncbi:hypothetical protein A2U01_0079569, partial [Trifolium medium]|nr:hypothetical protein [Trifolium medium]